MHHYLMQNRQSHSQWPVTKNPGQNPIHIGQLCAILDRIPFTLQCQLRNSLTNSIHIDQLPAMFDKIPFTLASYRQCLTKSHSNIWKQPGNWIKVWNITTNNGKNHNKGTSSLPNMQYGESACNNLHLHMIQVHIIMVVTEISPIE